MKRFAILLTLALALTSGCRRVNIEPAGGGGAGVAEMAEAPKPAEGTVGPLGSDCYDTTHAVACPPDPTDPSGRKLPAYGGSCHLPVCRPCGSEKALAFRDEHGVASAGFCICVPKSDDSGKGFFTCYSPEAWKNRSR